jgi:hypothetical protein
VDCCIGLRISPNAAFAHLHSKRAKSPQLGSAPLSQRRNDFIENGANHLLDIALKQLWILTRNTEYQL